VIQFVIGMRISSSGLRGGLNAWCWLGIGGRVCLIRPSCLLVMLIVSQMLSRTEEKVPGIMLTCMGIERKLGFMGDFFIVGLRKIGLGTRTK
jgi:hypothetical protein